MLDEVEGTQWVSRRNPAIRLPIDRLGRTSVVVDVTSTISSSLRDWTLAPRR